MKIQITDPTVANGAIRDVGDILEVDADEAMTIIGVGRGIAVVDAVDESSDVVTATKEAK